MADRYYVPGGFGEGQIKLAGTEAHHLLSVMRAKVGDRVELFDGLGATASGEIVAATNKSATVRILETAPAPAASGPKLTLVTAVPKGERFRWLVEKATELGVERLVPLAAARSVVLPGRGKLETMQQTVIAACKQSGRNVLMKIDRVTTWDEFVARDPAAGPAVIAHPSGQTIAEFLQVPIERDVTAVVGPEGGFTEAEIESATAAGARLVSLGTNILRTETAAVAMAAILIPRLQT